MESVLNEYISRELVGQSELLPLKNNTLLLKSGILDSLSLLKLVLFLEQQFGVIVDTEELLPENFETIDAICVFLRTQQQRQKAQA